MSLALYCGGALASHLLAPGLLAYTPFIDPINAHQSWYLLLPPLALLISIVYKAVRVGDMNYYIRQVLAMTLQVVVVMVLLAVGAFLLIQHILPVILPAT